MGTAIFLQDQCCKPSCPPFWAHPLHLRKANLMNEMNVLFKNCWNLFSQQFISADFDYTWSMLLPYLWECFCDQKNGTVVKAFALHVANPGLIPSMPYGLLSSTRSSALWAQVCVPHTPTPERGICSRNVFEHLLYMREILGLILNMTHKRKHQ